MGPTNAVWQHTASGSASAQQPLLFHPKEALHPTCAPRHGTAAGLGWSGRKCGTAAAAACEAVAAQSRAASIARGEALFKVVVRACSCIRGEQQVVCKKKRSQPSAAYRSAARTGVKTQPAGSVNHCVVHVQPRAHAVHARAPWPWAAPRNSARAHAQ